MKNLLSYKGYVNEKEEIGIKNYVYKGGSDSLTYVYFWSPAAQWAVDHVFPKWMAPNLITLIGFLFLFVSFIVEFIYSPDFKTPLPTWVIIFLQVSLLMYQYLDNCDGKQARSTKSSSPLGMLFDHGTDSIASWVITSSVLNILGMGQTKLFFLSITICGHISFYLGQRQQYCSGKFVLGYINAVDEGLIFVQLIYLFTACVGQSFWQIQVPGLGYNYGEIFVISSLILSVFQNLVFLYQGIDTSKNPNMKGISQMSSLWCCVISLLNFFLIIFVSSSNIISKYGFFLQLGLSLLWNKLILHIQIASLSGQKFQQWRVSFILGYGMHILNYTYCVIFGNVLVNEFTMIIIVNLLGVAAYVHTVYNIANHIADLLHIRIFKIPYQPKRD